MDNVISWLLKGDVTIQYMVQRYLLENAEALPELQNRIITEGFGKRFLECRNANGHWGIHYYQKKWSCTHYTLFDLKSLCVPETDPVCREMVSRMFNECLAADGGMNLSKYEHPSDICVDGMILNYASYFCMDEPRLNRLVDHFLYEQKPDGGFSWDRQSLCSDPHTTICILEGIGQYCRSGGRHRLEDLEVCQTRAVEYLVSNGLFIDSPDKRIRKLTYPFRYRYDLLRVLEYFATNKIPYEMRIKPALDWLQSRRRKDGLWYLEHEHKGNVHFVMEKVGEPSRFITLKALAILKHFDWPGRLASGPG